MCRCNTWYMWLALFQPLFNTQKAGSRYMSWFRTCSTSLHQLPQFVIRSLQNSKRLNKSQVTTHEEVCRSHRIDSILQKLSAHTRDYLRGTNWLSQGKQCPEEWPDIQLGLIVCWTIKCKKQVSPSAVICRRWSFSGSAFTGHTHLESRF